MVWHKMEANQNLDLQIGRESLTIPTIAMYNFA